MGLEEFRREVRVFLEAEWDAERYAGETVPTTASATRAGAWHAKLQEARLVAPHWPERFGGRGLTIASKAIVTEELVRVGAPPAENAIATGWAGPTILLYGTDEQRSRYLEPMLTGEEIWCQLFSEPDAGSDLASLTTRADRDGDEFVISGQKVWNSGAYASDFGILLARTNQDVPKHRGITYFIMPMGRPGVEIRRIRQMTGDAEFCEVFFDGARVPAANVVGEVDGGWRAAIATLMNERVNLSTGLGMLWGAGPAYAEFWRRFASAIPIDPIGRDRILRTYVGSRIIEFMRDRMLAAVVEGEVPGTDAAVQKLLADRFGQEVTNLAVDLRGPGGMLWGDALSAEARRWTDSFLFSRALTIGGGTEEVQKNILGERTLGLPSEPRLDTN